MKNRKFISLLIVGMLLGSVAGAVSLPRVKINTFGSPQARILNNAISQGEDAVNAVVVVDTNVTTTVTLYTPFEAGQILIGGAGAGTNAIWYASGATTNDWVQISSFD